MEVKIRLFAILREKANTREVLLSFEEDPTVQEALDELVKKIPSLGDMIFPDAMFNRSFKVFLNQQEISPERFHKTHVSENNELILLPPAGGGQE